MTNLFALTSRLFKPEWLEKIIAMYGRPDYIISDREENFHQLPEGGETIPMEIADGTSYKIFMTNY